MLLAETKEKTLGGAHRVEPTRARRRAHAELSTDHTDSAIGNRCLGHPKLVAVAWFSLVTGLSYFKSVLYVRLMSRISIRYLPAPLYTDL